MRALTRAICLLAIAGAGGCAQPAPSHEMDVAGETAAIRAIDVSWNEYLRTRNDSAIAAIYASDAVLFPPNMPRISGAASIRQFWAGLWPMKASLTLAPTHIDVTEDQAVEEGMYLFSNPLPGGGQYKDIGKYIMTWQKRGSVWQVTREIWNSDQPPPPTSK
jgi:ketosteroid isomerase-like protein